MKIKTLDEELKQKERDDYVDCYYGAIDHLKLAIARGGDGKTQREVLKIIDDLNDIIREEQ